MTQSATIQLLEARVNQLRSQQTAQVSTALIDAINDLALAQAEHCATCETIEPLLQESFDLAGSIQYIDGQVKSLITQSWRYVLLGEPERGMPAATYAIELAQTHASIRQEAIARYATSLVQAEIGSMAHSLENQLTALTLVQELGDGMREADYRTAIGVQYVRLAQYDQAREQLIQAVAVYRAINSRNLPVALNHLAMVHLYQNHFGVARQCVDEAMLLVDVSWTRMRAILLHTLGEICMHMAGAHAEQAQASFQQALALHEHGGVDDAANRADIILSWSQLLSKQGQVAQAIQMLQQLADETRSQQHKPILARVLSAIYCTYKQAGQFEKALVYHGQVYALQAELEAESSERQVRTLYIMHETREARRAAELMRLKTVVLEQMVRERTRDLERTQMEMLQRLAMAVETRDVVTGNHVVRVGDLSAKIAEHLGVVPEMVNHIRLAARLHDLGKIGIPDSILMKQGKLSAEEYNLMKSHTVKGATMLANSPMSLFRVAEEIALTHHERWDGRGYPHQIKGEDIPITGRIVAVADAYDAMTSERSYKCALPIAEAIAEIIRCSGGQFDPTVVQAFLKIIAPELDIAGLIRTSVRSVQPAKPTPQESTITRVAVAWPQTTTQSTTWSVPLRTVSEPVYTASVSVVLR